MAPVKDDNAEKRAQRLKFVEGSADKLPASVVKYGKMAAPVLVTICELIEKAFPFLVLAYHKVLAFWASLAPYHPEDLIPAIVGICLCFFGGTFPTLIAAVEAYRQVGWEPTARACACLWSEVKHIIVENKEDDKKDDNKDGVSDVKQINAAELFQRKALMVLTVVDPKQANDSVVAISAGFLAVVAALQVQFARAIAMGAGIGEILLPPIERYATPLLTKAIPAEYQKWIPVVLSYCVKSFAITIAWMVQRLISATHSALRGGQMAGRSIVNYANKMGYLKAKDDETNLDELIGFGLAGLGLLIQLMWGFRLPFPLNLVFLPASIADWALTVFIAK